MKHDFVFWLLTGMILRGWALAASDLVEEGIAQMLQALAGYEQTGAESCGHTIWRCLPMCIEPPESQRRRFKDLRRRKRQYKQTTSGGGRRSFIGSRENDAQPDIAKHATRHRKNRRELFRESATGRIESGSKVA